jgi:hypothetical protein
VGLGGKKYNCVAIYRVPKKRNFSLESVFFYITLIIIYTKRLIFIFFTPSFRCERQRELGAEGQGGAAGGQGGQQRKEEGSVQERGGGESMQAGGQEWGGGAGQAKRGEGERCRHMSF